MIISKQNKMASIKFSRKEVEKQLRELNDLEADIRKRQSIEQRLRRELYKKTNKVASLKPASSLKLTSLKFTPLKSSISRLSKSISQLNIFI